MPSPTANCRLFGNLQYGPYPRRSQFVGYFAPGRPSSRADGPDRWRRESTWNPTFSAQPIVVAGTQADQVPWPSGHRPFRNKYRQRGKLRPYSFSGP